MGEGRFFKITIKEKKLDLEGVFCLKFGYGSKIPGTPKKTDVGKVGKIDQNHPKPVVPRGGIFLTHGHLGFVKWSNNKPTILGWITYLWWLTGGWFTIAIPSLTCFKLARHLRTMEDLASLPSGERVRVLGGRNFEKWLGGVLFFFDMIFFFFGGGVGLFMNLLLFVFGPFLWSCGCFFCEVGLIHGWFVRSGLLGT